jgi:hypothetical protein
MVDKFVVLVIYLPIMYPLLITVCVVQARGVIIVMEKLTCMIKIFTSIIWEIIV